MLLKLKPATLDILPFYIVFLAVFPPLLWLLLRTPAVALGASVLLYALTLYFDWNIPAYPNGSWAFNPFAWQLLFVFGPWCALVAATQLSPSILSPITAASPIFYSPS